MELSTRRLKLILQTREEVEQTIAAMPEHIRAEVSPDWLARLRASTGPDPWALAFQIVQRDTEGAIGTCCFKGPPVDGVVEIAYAIVPDKQGQGYATEAAQALVEFAASREEVRLVRAHTLLDGLASKRVLAKCGFHYVGDVVEPEDGTVSRFEKVSR